MAVELRQPIIVNHMAAFDAQPGTESGVSFCPNSLEAIRACLEADAAFIEIDVSALQADDYLLVHDLLLDDETTGTGPIGAHTVEEAQALHFRRQGNPTQVRVPLLSEVVKLFQEYPTMARLQIDFKNMLPFTDDEPLTRLIHLIEPLGKRVIVSTGADWQLRKIAKLAPWLDLGFDIGFYFDWRNPDEEIHPLQFPKTIGAYGYADDHPLAIQRFWTTADYLADRCQSFIGLVPNASIFYISHVLLAKSLNDGFNWAEELHQAGIKLDAWTMDLGNPEAEMNLPRLIEAGVDQITTNTPNALANLLAVR